MPFITSFERLAKEEGREEGRDQGEQEGRQAGLKRGIQTALELKFGSAGLGLMPEINRLSDVQTLEQILDQIKTVNTPDELRAYWN